MAPQKTIRIGGASGFWGDSTIAAPQLLAGGKLDYLVFDYLAEITMSILARAKAKIPEHGYALDFVTTVMKESLPEIAKQGIKVISNAGGINPLECAAALTELIEAAGLDLKVATVTGDDLIGRVEELREAGVREMFSGAEMPAQFMSMNAYLGAFPIAEALGRGADIVITGRCVDSAVTLGACIHEFGWTGQDYDRLAAGSLAGHIIECGAQATGGLFTDWRLSTGWENIGYPIVEVADSGSFTVSKPLETGGLVTPGTVGEQMIYEIGDPQAYILPDVVCDFSGVSMKQTGEDRVLVEGARGIAPTPSLKVSATYMEGFRIGVMISIGGIDAKGKAEEVARAVLARTRRLLAERGVPDFTDTHVEILGTEASYGPHSRITEAREVTLKLAARHPIALALSLLLRELTSSGTSMSPGISGMGGNRPRPSPVVRLFSFLIDREQVAATVHMGGDSWETKSVSGEEFSAEQIVRPQILDVAGATDPGADAVTVRLIDLAYARSGDKGNDANVGVIARKPEYLAFVRSALTEENVREYFGHLVEGHVERYELPGIHALNFHLHEALGGGGIASLRNDPQGKALAQMLLDYPVAISAQLAARDGLGA